MPLVSGVQPSWARMADVGPLGMFGQAVLILAAVVINSLLKKNLILANKLSVLPGTAGGGGIVKA